MIDIDSLLAELEAAAADAAKDPDSRQWARGVRWARQRVSRRVSEAMEADARMAKAIDELVAEGLLEEVTS